MCFCYTPSCSFRFVRWPQATRLGESMSRPSTFAVILWHPSGMVTWGQRTSWSGRSVQDPRKNSYFPSPSDAFQNHITTHKQVRYIFRNVNMAVDWGRFPIKITGAKEKSENICGSFRSEGNPRKRPEFKRLQGECDKTLIYIIYIRL